MNMRKSSLICLSALFLVLVFTGPCFAEINDGLVGYYPFNGNANDESGFGHNGSVINAALTSDRYNIPNSAYVINGKYGIDLGLEAGFQLTNSVSVSSWIKVPPLVNQPSGQQLIGNYPPGSYTTPFFSLYLFNSGLISLGIRTNTPYTEIYAYSQQRIDDNQWHYITGIRDGSNGMIYLFVDGILQSSLQGGIDNIRSGYHLYVSRNAFDSNYMGRPTLMYSVDDLRIYNRVLSVAEVQELFNSSLNSSPSTPTPISADVVSYDAATGRFNVRYQWNPSTDPEEDPIQYCGALYADVNGQPASTPLYSTCDHGGFTSDTSSIVPFPLIPGNTYWWAVRAVDSEGHWSIYSTPVSFTATLDTRISLNELTNLYPYIYSNFIEDNGCNVSILQILHTCINDENYRLSVNGKEFVTENFNRFLQEHSRLPQPQTYKFEWEDGTLIQGSMFSSWFDAEWSNDISSNTAYSNKFNTVHKPTSITKPFEVISQVDQIGPICGTQNEQSYFFTYDCLNDQNPATTFDEWVNYLIDIRNYPGFNKPIDTLTIFAHGCPGKIKMADGGFYLQDDIPTEINMSKLRFDAEKHVLSNNATILLMSCNVGQGEEGKSFVRKLANWTGATIYANTEKTGDIKPDGNGYIIRDWDLDIIGVPDGYTFDEPLEIPVKSDRPTTLLLPGGVTIKYDSWAISQDDSIVISEASTNLPDIQGGQLIKAYDISFANPSTYIRDQNIISISFQLPSEYAGNSYIDPLRIGVVYWDETSMQWLNSGIRDVAITNDGTVINFNTTHFTTFAVVYNNQAPIADSGADIDIEIDSDCIATVNLDGSGSYDPDGDFLTYTWLWNDSDEDISILLPYNPDLFSDNGFILTGPNPTLNLPAGNYTFSMVVSDGVSNSQVDTVEVNVVETTPPQINVTATPAILWPPNHKMVQVTPTIVASDNCDPNPVIKLVSIKMNEGDQTNTYDPTYDYTTTSGNTNGDIQVDQNGNIYLRAERSGTNINGRIYTITYSATDAEGNSSIGSTTVKVPHNQ